MPITPTNPFKGRHWFHCEIWLNARQRSLGLFDLLRSYATMPNSSATKGPRRDESACDTDHHDHCPNDGRLRV
jgi:hypothetical protein